MAPLIKKHVIADALKDSIERKNKQAAFESFKNNIDQMETESDPTQILRMLRDEKSERLKKASI